MYTIAHSKHYVSISLISSSRRYAIGLAYRNADGYLVKVKALTKDGRYLKIEYPLNSMGTGFTYNF